MSSVVTAYVALGANLGDAQATLHAVISELARLPKSQLIAQSSLYSSPPFGPNADGPDYINAVVAIETRLLPHELLDQLQAMEHAHGRERHYQNAPRTLDLDIVLYGHEQIWDERLTIPHPRMHERAFVLLPLTEIKPDLMWHNAQGQLQVLQKLLPSVAGQQITKQTTI